MLKCFYIMLIYCIHCSGHTSQNFMVHESIKYKLFLNVLCMHCYVIPHNMLTFLKYLLNIYTFNVNDEILMTKVPIQHYINKYFKYLDTK